MDNFGNIINSMSCSGKESYVNSVPRSNNNGGSRVRVGDVHSFFNSATGKFEEKSSKSGNSSSVESNYNRQLENMSASAINNILSTYRKEIVSSGIPEEERETLKSRIRLIERELSSRGKSSFSASVMEDTSSVNAQEKKYQLGTGVGTSSLIFGIIGFMGSSLMGSKHPFMWGIAGAAGGGVMAFFMSQDKSFKLVNPIQETTKPK